MPSGKTHDKIAFLSLIPTFYGTYILTTSVGIASTITLSTIVAALLLSPDLDTSSQAYYRWGFLRFIWYPYRFCIPHRSKLSHSFILAPLIKIFYLIGVYFIVYMLVSAFFIDSYTFLHLDMPFIMSHLNYFSAAFMGIIWANAQHLMADYAVSKWKRYF